MEAVELTAWTRREVLSAMLGAPMAAAACRSAPPAPPIAGTIRGATLERGHRLVGGALAGRNSPRGFYDDDGVPTERSRIVIVGGGPSGLSAAWRLAREGEQDVVVLELEEQPGGSSASGTDGIVPYPWGAHYVPVPVTPNRALVTLFEEMGAIESYTPEGEPVYAEEQLVWHPEERLFYRGRWYEGLYLRAGASREDLAELEAFHAEIDRWVQWRDARGRRAFAIPMATSSTDDEVTALDRLSMAEWLDEHAFRSERLRWLVDYACRDDYGLTIEQTSAWAGVFYFASRIRQTGEEAADLLAWPDGNGHIVNHLMTKVGRHVRTGIMVVDLVPTPNAVEVTAWDTRRQSLVRYLADYAIFAGPRFLAAQVVRPWRLTPPPHVASFEYAPWMVANLHLRTHPTSRGAPPAWDNVLYGSPGLGYVTATHQLGISRGQTIWTYYYPFTDANPRHGRKRLLDLGHADFCDAILTDLGRAHHGLRAVVERIDVFRWGHAMVRPQTGFLFGEARTASLAPLGRIHFANSDMSGLALFEEAQYRGIAAAEAVLTELSVPFKSLLSSSS